MTIPFTIECKDIWLREYGLEDLDELYELTQQPEIHEFLPGWNVPKETRRHWLTRYETVENRQFLESVANGGDVGQLRLRMGIVSKQTGELIGWCCTGPKDELPLPNREIMYAISRDHRNKGYTTQAAQGLIQYLFAHTNVEVLSAVALLRNEPSNRVIQRCGFAYSGTLEIESETYNHYRLVKPKKP